MSEREEPAGITLADAVKYLHRYQSWRRGENDEPQPSPLMVGACLNVVLCHCEATLTSQQAK